MTSDARHAAEHVARVSYGRLLALLVSWSRDIAGAEDALAEAFASALATWPERGVPQNPDAWLLTAARNHLRNSHRRAAVRQAAMPEIERRIAENAGSADAAIPDERLKLMFVCAHPAIDPAVRTPLMLQTVLGIEAGRIASAFLVAPATMSQRLVRAKAKILNAHIRFDVPDGVDIHDRLGDVMDAIYAAYGTGWDAVAGAADGSQDLAQEAIYLGRLLLALMPDEPDVEGLLALMLYCEARRAARRSPLKRFVPLRDQDVSLWSRGMITEAESLLTSASQSARFGRYQCEAAIQSVHVQRAVTGVTNHDALKILYDLLAARCPSIGVLVGRAAAALDAGAAEKALDHLDALPAQQIEKYQPYWVTRAHALAATKNFNEARNALQRAIGLSEDSAVRSYLCDVSARWEAEN